MLSSRRSGGWAVDAEGAVVSYEGPEDVDVTAARVMTAWVWVCPEARFLRLVGTVGTCSLMLVRADTGQFRRDGPNQLRVTDITEHLTSNVLRLLRGAGQLLPPEWSAGPSTSATRRLGHQRSRHGHRLPPGLLAGQLGGAVIHGDFTAPSIHLSGRSKPNEPCHAGMLPSLGTAG